LRDPLGRWYFWFHQRFIRPVLGLIFDLLGGYFHVDGCKILVPKNLTTRSYRGCFILSDYEAEERALIRQHLLATDSVLELGACIGVVACVTNRLLADKSRHVVVEGNPKLIPTIEKNREINNCGFKILNKAASQEKTVTFYLSEEFIVGGTAQRKSPHPVSVEGITLEELDKEHGPFSVLIMDIEGGEVDTIPYSIEFLKKVRLVVFETHDWACGSDGTQRCRDALVAAGLKHVGTEGHTEAWLRPV
jgi:FkbM family methyltransferase